MGVEDFADIATEAFDVASEVLSDGAEFLSDGFDQLQEQVFDFAGESEWFNANSFGDIFGGPQPLDAVSGSLGGSGFFDGIKDFAGTLKESVLGPELLGGPGSGAGFAGQLFKDIPGIDSLTAKLPSLDSLIPSPASISKTVTDFAVKTGTQLVGQAVAQVVPPSLQPYANQAIGSVTRSLSAAGPVTDPNSPNFVGPPAPSNTSPASPATDEYPPGEYTTDSKGNTFKTLPDGTSSLVRAAEVPEDISPDTPGLVTKSPDTVSAGSVDNSAGNVGYVTGQDPENGTYYVKNEKTGQIVASGLTEQAATLKAQDQTFVDAGDVPPGANAGSSAVNYTAPGATNDPSIAALIAAGGDTATAALRSLAGTIADPNLALPPISTQAALAAAAALIPGGTAVTTAIADAAARAQGLLRQAQNQQTARVQANNNAATGDWRVRLQLADSSDYLYNAPDCGPLLWPLRDTNGVIFPYTPTIDTSYKANYSSYDLTHSNYRGYFYQNSYIDGINIKGTFTAQDSAEANYLLAVIHFFRSVTKMFYGQDAQRGTPPPMVFLSGLGDFQFNKHPCLVSQFNYNLPADVNYIRAQSTLSNGGNQLAARTRQTTLGNPIASTIQRLSSLGQKIFPGAVTAPFAPQGSLAAGNPTYVPTKMEISLVLLPVQTRSQVSQQFSVRGFANGNLLKGGFW